MNRKAFFKSSLLVGLFVGLLALGGCNSGSKTDQPAPATDSTATATTDSATTKAPTTDSATASPAATAAPSENGNHQTVTVTIDNMKFTPETITVNKGDKVTFINKDIVAHNATEINNVWHSPTLQNGQSWTFTPEKTSDYYCSIHVVMKGKIIVK